MKSIIHKIQNIRSYHVNFIEVFSLLTVSEGKSLLLILEYIRYHFLAKKYGLHKKICLISRDALYYLQKLTLQLFTAKPLYNERLRDPKILAVVDRWSLSLYVKFQMGPQIGGRCRDRWSWLGFDCLCKIRQIEISIKKNVLYTMAHN